MADTVKTMLRTGILQAAAEHYRSLTKASHATAAERSLFTLFAVECEVWVKELEDNE